MDYKTLNRKLELVKDKLSSIEHKSDKRIFIVCESEDSYEVNKFLFETLGCRFVIATCYQADNWFEILYHFSYDEIGCVITNKAVIRDMKNPAIESLTPFLPAAEWIEREMHDLMGINFRNHPNLKRLILADDWPEGVYPLRREVRK
jgi:Ni,Fe-hydrogenase III component G